MRIHRWPLLLLAGLFALPAFPAIVYDELVNGTFSSSGLSPTMLVLSPGSNQILGTNGSSAPAVRDYVAVTVPSGFLLTSLTLLDTAIGNVGFIGIQSGAQLTLPTNTVTAAGLLGWWHYTSADKNANLLPSMAVPANNSSGFTPPLPAGQYTLWIQDSSPGLFRYGFDLGVQAIPEPATLGCTLAGAGLLALLRRVRNARKA